MRIKVVGCYGGSSPGQGMTSFLIDDTVALDAGWLSFGLPLRQQEKIRDVLISHAHLDHTASLPFLIDNCFSAPGFHLRIHGIEEVIEVLRRHLFNGKTWPDFSTLPSALSPVLRFVEVPGDGRPFEVGGLTCRAVPVAHPVPTTGFIIEKGRSAIAFSSDTGPTEKFWQAANATRNLKAVITEASFPDEMGDLARLSGHFTPRTLALELDKLERDVPVYIYGRKPRFVKEVTKELRALRNPRLRLLEQGTSYRF